MARLPSSGSAVASLYEESTTLPDLISGLGLAPLSPDDEQKVRQDLEAVIGRGLHELASSPKYSADAKLQITDVQKTLRRVARGLKAMARGRRREPAELSAIEQILRGRETGFQRVHDIAAANEIVMALAGMVGDRDKAEAMVVDFANHPREIEKACRTAIETLSRIRGESGRPAIDWYTEFVGVLKVIALPNNIKPNVSVNPRTRKAQGRFLDLAAAVEQLLATSTWRSRCSSAWPTLI